MQAKSVKNRFSLWAGLCVFVTAIIIVSYSAITMRKAMLEKAVEENTLLAQAKASSIESRLNGIFDSANILAQTMSTIKLDNSNIPLDRDMVIEMLKNVLIENKAVTGGFICWEPNAFDNRDSSFSQDAKYGQTGRFAVLLTEKSGGEIDVTPLLMNPFLAPNNKPGEWYAYSKKEMEGYVLEPTLKSIENNQLMVTTMVLPIITKGKFYGVLALEMHLDFLQQMINEKSDLHNSAQIAVLSNQGVLVSVSGSPELVGKTIRELHSDYEDDLEHIAKGENLMEVMSGSMEFYVPVAIGNTSTPWAVNIVVPLEQYTSEITTIIIKMTVMTILCVVVALILLRYMASDIIGPLSKVVELAGALAQGDLTKRLEIKREDEIGVLSDALDGSCESLSATIAEVKENARMQATASQEMSSVSSQMAASAEEMSSQSESVAGATEQMSASINSMASASEEMSVNIQSVSSTAEQMSNNMNSIASSMEQMSASVEGVAVSAKEGLKIAKEATVMSNDTTQTMNTLGKAAEEIGEVTNLIKRIAEQTNLLALNATIEAASAGDAGKGFAVVANEIKELASQSGQAASAIAKRILGMQENTESAVQSITGISTIIQKMNEASSDISRSVEEQTSTSLEISDSVQQASSGISNIANSIAELARGANDVSKSAAEAARAINEVSANIQGMNAATKESSTGALEVNKTAEELAKIAAQLQEEVDKFKV